MWLDVPFVKQTEEGCGSASLSMVIRYWSEKGKAVPAKLGDPAAIQEKLYSKKARGILSSDMARYLKESGFRTFAISGQWEELRQHLSQGRPLIVGLQPRNKNAPFHYAVVTGLDWAHDAVFLNDPARGKLLRVEHSEFEKEWRATGNWMVVAVPNSAE